MAKPDPSCNLLYSSVDIEELDEVSLAHRRGSDYGGPPQPPGDPNRPQTDLTALLLDQFLTPIDKDVTANAAAAASTDAATASQLNRDVRYKEKVCRSPP